MCALPLQGNLEQLTAIEDEIAHLVADALISFISKKGESDNEQATEK